MLFSGSRLANRSFILCLSLMLCTVPAEVLAEQNVTSDVYGTNKAAKHVVSNRTKQNDANRDRSAVGLVLDIYGNWQVDLHGSLASLHQGDVIPNGALLHQGAQDSTLTLVLLDGTKCKCPVDPQCKEPIRLKNPTSASDNWYAATIGIFKRNPGVWIAPMSRAITKQTGLEDAVVMMEGGKLNLMSILEHLGAGSYYLNLESLTGTSPSRGPAEFSVIQGKRFLFDVGRIKPGLYKAVVTERTTGQAIEQCWLLITDSNHYQQKRSQFDLAHKTVSSWKDDVAPQARKVFLRAYLAYLNNTPDISYE